MIKIIYVAELIDKWKYLRNLLINTIENNIKINILHVHENESLKTRSITRPGNLLA